MERKSKNVVDFAAVKSVKEFVDTANEHIMELEHALYTILDTDRLDVAKEIAAEVLGEDLDVYLEEDTSELDFHDINEDELPW